MDEFGFPHFRKPPHDDNTLEFWKKTIFADESVFSSRVVSALEMGFWKGSSTTRGSFVRPTRNLQKYERFSPNHAIYSKIPSRKMETWFATILVVFYSCILVFACVCSMYTKSIRGLYCTMCKFGVSPMIAIKLKDWEIHVLKRLKLVILPKPSDFRSKIAMENAPAVRRWAPFASISRCQAELVTTHDSTLVLVLWCTFKPWVRGLSKKSLGMNHW